MVIAAGADALIVHARKAWLKGLSPRESTLDYGLVYGLKQNCPHVPIAINRGIASLDEAKRHPAACRRRHAGPRRLQGAMAMLAVDDGIYALAEVFD